MNNEKLQKEIEWKSIFYKNNSFSEENVLVFTKKILSHIQFKDFIAEYNMYYYFLQAVVYYLEYSCNYDDRTLDNVILIAKQVDKPMNDVLINSTADIMFYTNNVSRSHEKKIIEMMTFYSAFNQTFYYAYTDLDTFVGKLEKAISKYRNSVLN